MSGKTTGFLLAGALIAVLLLAPEKILAAPIPANSIVNPADPQCSTASDPPCYVTIQTAIEAANILLTSPSNTITNFTIMVEPGTYGGGITMQPNITLRGRETARTVLAGGGSGTLISASGVAGAFIEDFTFSAAAVGVDVSNNAGVRINNNVFTGMTTAAIHINNSSPSTAVINNTFFQNATAVSSNTDVRIINNIFSNTAIGVALAAVSPLVAFTQVTFNFFQNVTNNGFAFDPNATNTSNNLPTPLKPKTDPLFVNILPVPPALDLHLKTDSPCIGQGTNELGANSVDGFTSDLGAYGGGQADTIPFRISGVAAATGTSAITISWSPNAAYQITNYLVYYGKSSGVYTGTDATEGPSPIKVDPQLATSQDLSDIGATPAAPTAPVLNPLQILNGALRVSWSEVPGVTQYKVYYSTDPFDASTLLPDTFAVVDNATSYTIAGLTNGQTYYVAVSAVAQAALFVAVTAYQVTDQSIDISTLTVGKDRESAFSEELKIGAGAGTEGPISAVLQEFPDELIANPPLVNTRQGCFIATAAYGHYSAPQVQALRDFRDRFLLTNRPGRAFVAWYYTYGPAAAQWMDGHPGYKPAVRAALLPAVGFSLLMTRSPLTLAIGTTAALAGLVAYGYFRRRSLRAGGPR